MEYCASGIPELKLDDFIEKMINKRIGKKAYSTLYSQRTGHDIADKTRVNNCTDEHIRVRKSGENVNYLSRTWLVGNYRRVFC